MLQVITGFPEGTIQSKHATIRKMVCYCEELSLTGIIVKDEAGLYIKWSDLSLSGYYPNLSALISESTKVKFYQF